MDKHYLLLRNNQQKGPFTLEELVQLGLKPNDLIWIEGLSSSWSYPSEITLLKPYLSSKEFTNKKGIASKEEKSSTNTAKDNFTNKNTSSIPASTNTKHIYVSFPNAAGYSSSTTHHATSEKSLEQKAEELKKKVETYVSEVKKEAAESELPNYTPRSLNDLRNDYSAWMHKQQKAKKSRHIKKNSIVTIATILIVGVGYVLAKDAILTKRAAADLTIKNNFRSEEGKTAKKKHQKPELVKELDSFTSVDYNQPDSEKIDVKGISAGVKKNLYSPPVTTVKIPVPAVTDIEKDMEASLPPIEKDSVTEQKNQSKNDAHIEKDAKSNNTLGSKISNFFSKFKHKNRDEKPADKTGAGNDLSAKAEITVATYSNAASGTNGLKITFYNHADQPVKKAVVEVQYFDTTNSIIDKRLVNFTNVASKSSATIMVPNKQLADHTNYQLLSLDH